MAEDVSAALIEKMVRRRYAGFSEDKIAEKIREELDRAAGKEKPVERANSARTFKATRRDALADTLDELEWRADCLRSRMDAADPCWEGYEQRGTKEKDGRTVPNCVEADAHAVDSARRKADAKRYGGLNGAAN